MLVGLRKGDVAVVAAPNVTKTHCYKNTLREERDVRVVVVDVAEGRGLVGGVDPHVQLLCAAHVVDVPKAREF